MATADVPDAAPIAASLGREANEKVLTLLAEISTSLKDLKGHSEQLVSLADRGQLSGPDTERRASQRNTRHSSRRSSRVRSHRRPRSTKSGSKYFGTSRDLGKGVEEGEAREDSGDPAGPRHSDNRTVEVLGRSVEAGPRDGLGSTASDDEIDNPKLQGYTSLKLKYEEFPDPDLSWQMFGKSLQRENDACSSWLKEKGLVFARDERCSFTFDNFSLAGEPDLQNVQFVVENIKNFALDLRARGGFFFFRESYTDSRKGDNKIYNGTHVFRCKDGMIEVLPHLLKERNNFSEAPEIRPREETRYGAWLRRTWDERKKKSQELEHINRLTYGDDFLDPCVTYHYEGQPVSFERETHSERVTMDSNGFDQPKVKVSKEYKDPHLTVPWRRLCVLTGLSRIPNLDAYTPILRERKVPLFSPAGIIHGSRSGSDVSHYDDSDFYQSCIWEYLDCKQQSMQESYRRRVIQFQFSWYEIVFNEKCEKRQYAGRNSGRYSGRLYRDKFRSLQLQSFMAVGVWQRLDEDSIGDSKFWTLVVMAPAFFYHSGQLHVLSDPYKWIPPPFLRNLIAPLESIIHALEGTLLMVKSRIVEDWTHISEYIEQFIVGQDTFLHEDQHDRLLFDDENFTRSRQYFWVITSTEEFIRIVDETIKHYEQVHCWLDKRADYKIEDATDLKSIKERFERQRSRATALRDGLFSASAVVESQLSTRLAQNVKLLTYVSIFYLPLAFCAALWAIPDITDPATRNPFIVAAILVGFATYLTVFNLDALVSLGSTAYSGFRTKRLQQMAQDQEHDTWQERARGFNRFQPDRGRTKPSEWYVVLYWLGHLCSGSRQTEEGREEYAFTRPDASSTGGGENSRGKGGISWLRRRLFGKSENTGENEET